MKPIRTTNNNTNNTINDSQHRFSTQTEDVVNIPGISEPLVEGIGSLGKLFPQYIVILLSVLFSGKLIITLLSVTQNTSCFKIIRNKRKGLGLA